MERTSRPRPPGSPGGKRQQGSPWRGWHGGGASHARWRTTAAAAGSRRQSSEGLGSGNGGGVLGRACSTRRGCLFLVCDDGVGGLGNDAARLCGPVRPVVGRLCAGFAAFAAGLATFSVKFQLLEQAASSSTSSNSKGCPHNLSGKLSLFHVCGSCSKLGMFVRNSVRVLRAWSAAWASAPDKS